MLSTDQRQSFAAFYGSARRNEVLDEETRIMLHLCAAMASGCEPCMEHYLQEAERIGLCADKVGAVQAIAMAVAAGKINAQVRGVQERLGEQPAKVEQADTGGACCEPGSGCC